LISKHGSIDWLCWPRFDSGSVLARFSSRNRWGLAHSSYVAHIVFGMILGAFYVVK